MSSSMPHLQAAHWMISSVVPTKSPSTRWNPAQSSRVLALEPRVLLAVALSGRISAAGRTRAAHSAPDGSVAPSGSVSKRSPPPGGGVGGTVGGGGTVVGGGSGRGTLPATAPTT